MRVSTAVAATRTCATALMALAIAACGGSHDSATASATDSTAAAAKATPKGCDADNGGLTLPNGFCASVFADHLGHPRHLAVAPNGVVYVNTWSGRYYGNDTTPAGGFLVALRDTSGSGHADVIQRFGPSAQAGGHGGTGIALHGAWLFAEESDRDRALRDADGRHRPHRQTRRGRVRHAVRRRPPHAPVRHRHLGRGVRRHGLGHQLVPAQEPYAALAGTPAVHRARDARRHLALRRATAPASTSRRRRDTPPASGTRSASPSRLTAALFSTQHGRDQLSDNWPELYTNEQSAELPAEELMQIEHGADYGWPYCYFDGAQKKLMLAPEYGGDGTKVGLCDKKRAPVAYFPATLGARWAHVLLGVVVPRALSRRRLHRVPRLVEPRALAAGRIPRGVRPVPGRHGERPL